MKLVLILGAESAVIPQAGKPCFLEEARMPVDCGQGAVQAPAIAAAHRNPRTQKSLRLVSCLGQSVILWVVEHLTCRKK